jgi:uncharacterized protein (DUF169 family)
MSISHDLLEPLARLNLRRPPVAMAFLATPPAGLQRVDRAQPAGCGYWKLAADGHAFYTTSADHENCPVGAFTHAAPLSAEKSKELEALVGTMVELRYLKPDEVKGIPHRTTPLQVAAYAPLPEAPFDADLVIFRGDARQIMLVSEAARAAGVFSSAQVMGRPACAMIPAATSTSSGVASVGCIGNRVYTDLGDEELYFSVPGRALNSVLEQLGVILEANRALEAFHRQRASRS